MRALAILFLSCIALNAQPVFSLKDEAFISKTSPLLSGLVGYWQMEESSGTRYDRSIYGNHLTANNSVGQGAGKVGNCATFVRASNQYLAITNSSSLSVGSSEFTISCWVKINANNIYQNFISKGAISSSTNTEWTLNDYNNGLLQFVIFDGYGGKAPVYGPAMATNTWYFLVGWWDKSLASAYLQVNNGTTYNASFTSNCWTSSTLFQIGGDYYTGYHADGSIDEVGYWKRKLSSSEKTKLYKSGLGTTYPRFSINDATDFDFDTWQPLYDRPKTFPTLVALVTRREPEPLITLCE